MGRYRVIRGSDIIGVYPSLEAVEMSLRRARPGKYIIEEVSAAGELLPSGLRSHPAARRSDEWSIGCLAGRKRARSERRLRGENNSPGEKVPRGYSSQAARRSHRTAIVRRQIFTARAG
jgi:hypothetical protein